MQRIRKCGKIERRLRWCAAVALSFCAAACGEEHTCGASDGAVNADVAVARTDSGVPDVAVAHTDSGVDGGYADADGWTSPCTILGPAIPACAKRLWTTLSEGGTATVTPCGLTLVSPGTEANNRVSVTQGGLEGDFTLTVEFDSFRAALLDFEARLGSQDSYLYSEIWDIDISAGYSIGQTYTDQSVFVTTTRGTIEFTRTGSTGTVKITAGGQLATITGDIGRNPVSLSLSTEAYSNGPTGVNVRSVSATGNTGTFQSDSFRCNSL